jgi:hypothetical protein
MTRSELRDVLPNSALLFCMTPTPDDMVIAEIRECCLLPGHAKVPVAGHGLVRKHRRTPILALVLSC